MRSCPANQVGSLGQNVASFCKSRPGQSCCGNQRLKSVRLRFDSPCLGSAWATPQATRDTWFDAGPCWCTPEELMERALGCHLEPLNRSGLKQHAALTWSGNLQSQWE